jgi:hypothetical protein
VAVPGAVENLHSSFIERVGRSARPTLLISAICLVAGARNHLQANRSVEFSFEILI